MAGLLESAEVAVARTMPENPHWYKLRKTWARDEDFVWVVGLIRALGQRRKFQGHWYTQLDINDHVYWTMGWTIGPLDRGWDRAQQGRHDSDKSQAAARTVVAVAGACAARRMGGFMSVRG